MSTEISSKLDTIIELLNDLPDKMIDAINDDKRLDNLIKLAIATNDFTVIEDWKNK